MYSLISALLVDCEGTGSGLISRVSLNRAGGNSLYPFLKFALYCSNGESEQS